MALDQFCGIYCAPLTSTMNFTFVNASDLYNSTSANNSFRRFSPDDLVFGIYVPLWDWKCGGSIQNFLNCDLIGVQVLVFWIQLLAPRNSNVVVQFYGPGQNGMLYEDMSRGFVHASLNKMLAFESLLSEKRRFHETITEPTLPFYMYNRRIADSNETDEWPVDFLLAPFSRNMWLLVGAYLSILFASKLFVRRWINGRNISFSSKFLWIAAAGLYFCKSMYNSNLKAILTKQIPAAPFRDLYELAEMVRRGEKKLVVEDTASIRWLLLTSTEAAGFRSGPSKTLHEAILRRGPNSSAIAETNRSKICQMLAESDVYVYFAHDGILEIDCPSLCIWRYEVHEYPSFPQAYRISKHNRNLARKADVLVHSLRNYHTRLKKISERRRGCPDIGQPKAVYIGFHSLSAAFIVLVIGLLASVLIYGCEKLYGGYSHRRYVIIGRAQRSV